MDVYDHGFSAVVAQEKYRIEPVTQPEQGAYDEITLAVGDKQFKAMGVQAIRKLGKDEHIIYDLK